MFFAAEILWDGRSSSVVRFLLEQYFRQLYAETGKYNQITQYWKKDGKDEIDLIGINDTEKELVIGEIKRNPDKISLSDLQEKAAGLLPHHNKWTISFVGLSLKDM